MVCITNCTLIPISSQSERSVGVEPACRSYCRTHSRSHCCFSTLAVYSTSPGQRKTQWSCRSGRGGGRLPTRAAKANEWESALARLWKRFFFFLLLHTTRGGSWKRGGNSLQRAWPIPVWLGRAACVTSAFAVAVEGQWPLSHVRWSLHRSEIAAVVCVGGMTCTLATS